MRAKACIRIDRAALDSCHSADVIAMGPMRGQCARSLRVAPENLVLPPANRPLHFSQQISALCEDIRQRTPELRHIDMRRVLPTFVRCRNPRPWGMQAKLVPLRFRNGALRQMRRGHPYQVQQFYLGAIQLQYILSFYMPRFLNQSFDEKLITIFHELYHIGPDFSGDIRRFDGPRSIHASTQKRYDVQMAEMARRYLHSRPARVLFDFLHLSYDRLRERHGEVVGIHVPTPKLIPVSRIERAAVIPRP